MSFKKEIGLGLALAIVVSLFLMFVTSANAQVVPQSVWRLLGTSVSTNVNSWKAGIGTTSPHGKLTVQGTSGSTDNVFEVATSTGAPTFKVASDGTVTIPGNFTVSGTCTGCGTVNWPWTVATNYATSTNSTTTVPWYKLGVTASSTSYLQNLTVTGDFNSGSGTGLWAAGASSSDSNAYDIWNPSLNPTLPYFSLRTSGYIGLSTTTPNWPLTVANSAAIPQFAIVDSSSPANRAWTLRNSAGSLYIATSTTDATSTVAALGIDTNGKVIFMGGRVGISTTTPQAPLSLGGDLSASPHILMGTYANNTNYALHMSGGRGMIGYGNDAIMLAGGGQNGILFYVNGTNDTFPSTLTGTAMYVSGGAAGRGISASVGIGTTSPTRPLTISSSTAPQLSLTDASLTSLEWTFRNAGGLLFIATSTYSATSTVSAMSLNANGSLSVANLVSCAGVQTSAAGLMSCTSDARLKDVHAPFTTGLDAVKKIHPQTWSYKKGTESYDGVNYNSFIAQDVQAAIPEAVNKGYGDWLQINMWTVLASTVNAIKELATHQDEQDAQIAELRAEIESLKANKVAH